MSPLGWKELLSCFLSPLTTCTTQVDHLEGKRKIPSFPHLTLKHEMDSETKPRRLRYFRSKITSVLNCSSPNLTAQTAALRKRRKGREMKGVFSNHVLVSMSPEGSTIYCCVVLTFCRYKRRGAMYAISSVLQARAHFFTPCQLQIGEGDGTPLQCFCLENPMDRGAWQAAVYGVTKNRTRLSDFTFTFPFHALEKEMATHPSVLAWRIPGMGEPGGLLSMGLHRVRHN